jgi:hypothetical protein
MRWTLVTVVFGVGYLHAQSAAQNPAKSFEALRFLEGTWEAKTSGDPAGPAASGTYSFKKELGGHILARHSSSDACKGPSDFNCDHHDLLYIYQDAPGQPLKAIYFDNEGHTIHYDVLTPSTEVVFLSDASFPGPRFRLNYALQHAALSGKFQMQMPGQTEWKSYLEWSGPKK